MNVFCLLIIERSRSHCRSTLPRLLRDNAMVQLSPRLYLQFLRRIQWGWRRRYIRPQIIPRITPITSATKSFISALRLKLGWMSSITPPKRLAPKNTGLNPKRPVLERGKASAAKAMMCTNLSLPSGAGGGLSKGHSIVTARIRVRMRVIRMSRYLRIMRGYYLHRLNTTSR